MQEADRSCKKKKYIEIFLNKSRTSKHKKHFKGNSDNFDFYNFDNFDISHSVRHY
jgi:hypothetical protein